MSCEPFHGMRSHLTRKVAPAKGWHRSQRKRNETSFLIPATFPESTDGVVWPVEETLCLLDRPSRGLASSLPCFCLSWGLIPAGDGRQRPPAKHLAAYGLESSLFWHKGADGPLVTARGFTVSLRLCSGVPALQELCAAGAVPHCGPSRVLRGLGVPSLPGVSQRMNSSKGTSRSPNLF